MEMFFFGNDAKITMDTLIALVALVVSVVSLGASIRFWYRSFRPIVTATVKTHAAGNEAITYDLVLLNSGTIPAKDISIVANDSSLASALGGDATPEHRRMWLACFTDEIVIPILHNGDRVSCSFGMTKGCDMGFWKYKASISIVIKYSGWFGLKYEQPQELRIVDSHSFTGFMWAKPDA